MQNNQTIFCQVCEKLDPHSSVKAVASEHIRQSRLGIAVREFSCEKGHRFSPFDFHLEH